mgnify:CR=1 FL=1
MKSIETRAETLFEKQIAETDENSIFLHCREHRTMFGLLGLELLVRLQDSGVEFLRSRSCEWKQNIPFYHHPDQRFRVGKPRAHVFARKPVHGNHHPCQTVSRRYAMPCSRSRQIKCQFT